MAIRDVVTMGYGNGTYDPGVNKIPTLGYSIGVVSVSLASQAFFTAPNARAEFTAADNTSEFTAED